MNVLIVNWSGHYGGVEKHLTMLAEGFDRNRYHLVFAFPHNGPFAEMVQAAGYQYYDIPSRPGWDWESISKLCRIILREQIDLVHAQQSRCLLQGGIAARLAGVQGVVQTEHNISLDWYRRARIPKRIRWINNLVRHFVVRFLARKIIALSSGVARFYTEVLRINPGKVVVIPHAHQVVQERCTVFSPNASSPIIGTVANLTEQKGLPYLIKAAAIVLKSHPEAQFHFVGEGHLRNSLQQYIEALGVTENVKLLGFQPNAAALMSTFDIFVLPSLWEPFGLVLLEAMANGLPIIATDVDGVADVVLDGQTGILVPPADPEALAMAIRRLIEHPDLAREMGRRGWERCATEFNVENMVKRIAGVYDEVAALG